MPQHKSSTSPIVIASFLLLAGMLFAFRGFTAEDGYIVARYAENLARHHELTYNIGERICALTSPLHALMSALLAAVFGNAVFWPKVASVFATATALGAMLWGLRKDAFSAALCAAMVVPSPFIALWTVGGLETPFVLFLMTLLTLTARSHDRASFGAGRIFVGGLLIGFGFLARYDTATYSLPVGLYLLCRGTSIRQSIAALFPGALIALMWLSFSKIYYHDILPTSFYVKRPGFGLPHLVKDAIYEFQLFLLSGLAIVAVLIVSHARKIGARSLSEAVRRNCGIYAGLALFLAYGLTACTVHMMFAYRMLAPFIPSAALACFDLLSTKRVAGEQIGARAPLPLAITMLLLNATIAGFMYVRALNPGFIAEYRHESLRDYSRMLAVLRMQADEVRVDWERRPQSRQRPPRIETFAAGVVPYYDRDAYIIEQLVSYRKHCTPPLQDSADYIHVVVPGLGTLQEQLGRQYGHVELISAHVIEYDGKLDTFMIYYQPNPMQTSLPIYVDDPCPRR